MGVQSSPLKKRFTQSKDTPEEEAEPGLRRRREWRGGFGREGRKERELRTGGGVKQEGAGKGATATGRKKVRNVHPREMRLDAQVRAVV